MSSKPNAVIGDDHSDIKTIRDNMPQNASEFLGYPFTSGELWLMIDSLKYGGIETHVFELAQGLKRYNIPVRVFFITRFKAEMLLADKLKHQNIAHSFLNQSRHQGGVLRTLIAELKCHRPCAVHAHGYKASLISRLACRVTQTPHCTTYHAGESPTGKVRLYDWLDRHTAIWSKRVFSVSEAIAKKLPIQSYVLNNFVSLPCSTPAKMDKNAPPHPLSHSKSIAFIGRLSQEKAPERFVQLANEFPEQTFDIFGDGELKSQLSPQLSDNVTMHGHLSDMSQAWRTIGVLVIPSRYEGLPLVALEAMIRGIPVIATAVGALPQLIVHQVNGFVAQEPSLLNNYLAQWLSMSDSEKQTMAGKAKETIASQYTSDAVIPQLVEHYNAIGAGLPVTPSSG